MDNTGFKGNYSFNILQKMHTQVASSSSYFFLFVNPQFIIFKRKIIIIRDLTFCLTGFFFNFIFLLSYLIQSVKKSLNKPSYYLTDQFYLFYSI